MYWCNHNDLSASLKIGNRLEKEIGVNNMTLENLSQEELKKRLTTLQYKVTQEGDTKEPFANAYWAEKREGI